MLFVSEHRNGDIAYRHNNNFIFSGNMEYGQPSRNHFLYWHKHLTPPHCFFMPLEYPAHVFPLQNPTGIPLGHMYFSKMKYDVHQRQELADPEGNAKGSYSFTNNGGVHKVFREIGEKPRFLSSSELTPREWYKSRLFVPSKLYHHMPHYNQKIWSDELTTDLSVVGLTPDSTDPTSTNTVDFEDLFSTADTSAIFTTRSSGDELGLEDEHLFNTTPDSTTVSN
ncbi:hypothetical protein JTB14_021699 [Gonioctena quinquepunctata]|nr:hypothetical protein JTB14_021699 [Gonioctena quinquepunctata]